MIDEKLLRELAVLARIDVTDNDISARLADFQSVIGCISALDAIDIPADFQFSHTVINRCREDIVKNPDTETVSRIIDLFPENVGTLLSVPKVL
jgi:aspartyl/glutamyl-tRNA(Asn/Gln) amidotransferase C subunit